MSAQETPASVTASAGAGDAVNESNVASKDKVAESEESKEKVVMKTPSNSSRKQQKKGQDMKAIRLSYDPSFVHPAWLRSLSTLAAVAAAAPAEAASDEEVKKGGTAVPKPKTSSRDLAKNYDPVSQHPAALPAAPPRVFAPLNIPLARRRQTAAVLFFMTFGAFCLGLCFVFLRSSGWPLYLFLAHATWIIFFQTHHKDGGRRIFFMRDLFIWHWFRDYFPVTVHKTVDIEPKDRPLMFGAHPHGIISISHFLTFGTEALGFSKLFPGINVRLLTLSSNFRIPFYTLWLAALGICDSSKESCNAILSKGGGHALTLVLGGASEALMSKPGTADLTLNRRKGFVKLALKHGAGLVPVFSFGETNLWDQIEHPVLLRMQKSAQKLMGFSLPMVRGRGVFQYRIGLLPYRRPLRVVIGAPVECPKTAEEDITPDLIAEYHAKYVEALTNLYETHKEAFDPGREQDMRIVA